MALIECPECKGQVSDKAEACPHCGAPVQNKQQNPELICEDCGHLGTKKEFSQLTGEQIKYLFAFGIMFGALANFFESIIGKFLLFFGLLFLGAGLIMTFLYFTNRFFQCPKCKSSKIRSSNSRNRQDIKKL